MSKLGNGRLVDVKLNKEELGFTLDLKYEYTDKIGNVHEYVITKVQLFLYSNPINIEGKFVTFSDSCNNSRIINVGYGDVVLFEDSTIKDRIIKYAIKEMTIEEIEKKLGHKVKIVGEKGEKE